MSQQRVDRCFCGTENAQVAVETLWSSVGYQSDQASLFVGSWFEKLCAGMGIWQAFSKAYHHQANGRAERAGQSLMEILREIYENKSIHWVEALSQTLDRYHDVPNLSGLSPYQIIFGRHRPLGNVPYTPRVPV